MACDILIYVEIKEEQRTRPEEHDHRMNVAQLKSKMFLSFGDSTEISVAYASYLCLKHMIGLCQCFLDGPRTKSIPPRRVGLQWVQSLASVSSEERFLKGGGSALWWRGARHQLQSFGEMGFRPSLDLSGCVTLGKSVSLEIGFLLCKQGTIIKPIPDM